METIPFIDIEFGETDHSDSVGIEFLIPNRAVGRWLDLEQWLQTQMREACRCNFCIAIPDSVRVGNRV